MCDFHKTIRLLFPGNCRIQELLKLIAYTLGVNGLGGKFLTQQRDRVIGDQVGDGDQSPIEC